MDLKFPHHECEIAQAVGAFGKEPVSYWIHSNMLTVNGQKMSKSLGNSFLPSELFSGTHPLLTKGYSAMTVRTRISGSTTMIVLGGDALFLSGRSLMQA